MGSSERGCAWRDCRPGRWAQAPGRRCPGSRLSETRHVSQPQAPDLENRKDSVCSAGSRGDGLRRFHMDAVPVRAWAVQTCVCPAARAVCRDVCPANRSGPGESVSLWPAPPSASSGRLLLGRGPCRSSGVRSKRCGFPVLGVSLLSCQGTSPNSSPGSTRNPLRLRPLPRRVATWARIAATVADRPERELL